MNDKLSKPKYLRWIWLSIVIVLLDQWVKHLALHHLSPYHALHILPFLNFTLAFNPGAAFSLLGSAGGWQRWLFTIVAVVICVVILIWLGKLPPKKHFLAFALSLILGGAIANLWDRVTLGYVIDFIDVYVKHWHWPAFNIADGAITIGVILLLVDLVFSKKKPIP